MTGTTGTDAWGASRTSDRRRRRRKRAAITATTAVALLAGAPLIGATWPAAGVAATPLVTAIGLLAIVAVALGRGWRDADELLRERALRVFAAVGVVTLVGNPVAEMLGKGLHMPAPVDALWWLSIAVGAAVLLAQRWLDQATG